MLTNIETNERVSSQGSESFLSVNVALMHLVSLQEYAYDQLYIFESVEDNQAQGGPSTVIKVADGHETDFQNSLNTEVSSFEHTSDQIVLFIICTPDSAGASPCFLLELLVQTEDNFISTGADRYQVSMLRQNAIKPASSSGQPLSINAIYRSEATGGAGALAAIAFSDSALITTVFPTQFPNQQRRIEGTSSQYNGFNSARFDPNYDMRVAITGTIENDLGAQFAGTFQIKIQQSQIVGQLAFEFLLEATQLLFFSGGSFSPDSGYIDVLDVSWIEEDPIFLMRTNDPPYLLVFNSRYDNSGAHEMIRFRLLNSAGNVEKTAVIASQIQCFTDTYRCIFAVIFEEEWFMVVQLAQINTSLEIERIQKSESANIQNSVHLAMAFKQSSAKRYDAFFAFRTSYYGDFQNNLSYGTIIGSSLDTDCMESIGLAYVADADIGSTFLIEDGIDRVEMPLNYFVPVAIITANDQASTMPWLETDSQVSAIKVLQHEDDYDSQMLHETWFDSSCQLQIDVADHDPIRYEIQDAEAGSQTAENYSIPVTSASFLSTACPDRIKSVKMRISDDIGDLPVQELDDSGYTTESDGASLFYQDPAVQSQFKYGERDNVYGQGYNERALELAYMIHGSFTVANLLDIGHLTFWIDTNDIKFDGLKLVINFDFYTSWEIVTAASIEFETFVNTIIYAEVPPVFSNPPQNNELIVLDTDKNKDDVKDFGGVESVYGSADHIYMQVYWTDFWRETLMYASVVPLSVASTVNNNVFQSSNAADPKTYPFQNHQAPEYASNLFPASFQISNTNVFMNSEFKDEIFDSGLYRIYETQLDQVESDQSGGGRRLSEQQEEGGGGSGNFVSVLTQVQINMYQEILIEAKIILQSSYSGLETSYDVFWRLNREIQKQIYAYVVQELPSQEDESMPDDNSQAVVQQSQQTQDSTIQLEIEDTNQSSEACTSTQTNEAGSSNNSTITTACLHEEIEESAPVADKNSESYEYFSFESNPVEQSSEIEVTVAEGSGSNSTASQIEVQETVYEKETETYQAVVSDPIDETVQQEIEQDVQELIEENSGDIDQAIATILDVEDVEEATQNAQRIAELKDDTDLEAAAEFDIFAYLAEKGIKTKYSSNLSQNDEVSNFAVEKEMKEEFILPQLSKISKDGGVQIRFSSEIVPVEFSQIIYYLKKEQAITGKRILKDQVPTSQDENTQIDQLESLESLLKIAGCIQIELVPGVDTNLPKKKFTWQLSEYSESQLAFKLYFNNPEYISMESPDSIKIIFQKTSYFMQSAVQGKSVIPDNFSLIAKLPTQSEQNVLLTEEQVKTASQSTQSIVLMNILLDGIFSSSLQVMFSSIISLQILAHLPLANIQLPANAQQTFDIMMDVVSFDYFPIHQVFDFGFTKTKAWSLKFFYLDYESVNFIEGMGSIILFMWLGAIYLGLVFLLFVICKNVRCRQRCFRPLKTWDKTLVFLEGTFFESMICVSVSMRSFQYFDYLNTSDKFSIANHMIVLLVLVLFVSLITYFTVFRMPKLVSLYIFKQRKKKYEYIMAARSSFKNKLKESKMRRQFSVSTRQKILKEGSVEADEYIESQEKLDELLKSQTKGLKRRHFRLYRPLFHQVRKKSHLALMNNFLVILRRLALLYIAMFLENQSWFQVILFTFFSVAFIIYLCFARPMNSRFKNNLSLFNEGITCIVAYLIMVLNGLCNQAAQYQHVGTFIVRILYVCWAVNALIILILMILGLKKLCIKCHKNRCKKRRQSKKKTPKSLSKLSTSAGTRLELQSMKKDGDVSVIVEEARSLEDSFDKIPAAIATNQARQTVLPQNNIRFSIRMVDNSLQGNDTRRAQGDDDEKRLDSYQDLDAEQMISQLQIVSKKQQDQLIGAADPYYQLSESEAKIQVPSIRIGRLSEGDEPSNGQADKVSAGTDESLDDSVAHQRPHFLIDDQSFSEVNVQKLECQFEEEVENKGEEELQEEFEFKLEKDVEEEKKEFQDQADQDAAAPWTKGEQDLGSKKKKAKKLAAVGRVGTKELFETNFQFFKYRQGSLILKDEPMAQNFTADDDPL